MPPARLASSPPHAVPIAIPTPARSAAKLVVSMPNKPRIPRIMPTLRSTTTAVPMYPATV